MKNSSELSPKVNSLDIAIKTRAENLTKKQLCSSPHSPLRSGRFVLISLFSPFHVHVSPSPLLIDFFSHFSSSFHFRIAPSPLDSVSSESQSHHRTTFLVCFRCVTLCHQFLLRIDVCEIRQLLLHYVLHKHVFQHHVFHSNQSSLGCPCFCRLTVDMIHENHFMSQSLPVEMFRHHSFCNSSRQGV